MIFEKRFFRCNTYGNSVYIVKEKKYIANECHLMEGRNDEDNNNL